MRQWAKRGTRPRQPADQRYQNAYLFGAICPARGTGAALALPYADTHAMQLHLEEISRTVKRGAHAVLLMDRAGWHTTTKLKVPKNITPIFLPSRTPELNPVENVWQYLRSNWLSNRVRGLQRHHRCRLPGLAEPDRRAHDHYLDRNPKMGNGQSIIGAVGINSQHVKQNRDRLAKKGRIISAL